MSKRKLNYRRQCPCAEAGKNRSVEHTSIVGTITAPGGRPFNVCGNHLGNYDRLIAVDWTYKPKRRLRLLKKKQVSA